MDVTRSLNEIESALFQRHLKLSRVVEDIVLQQFALKSKAHLLEVILDSIVYDEENTEQAQLIGEILLLKGSTFKKLSKLPSAEKRFKAMLEKTRINFEDLMDGNNV